MTPASKMILGGAASALGAMAGSIAGADDLSDVLRGCTTPMAAEGPGGLAETFGNDFGWTDPSADPANLVFGLSAISAYLGDAAFEDIEAIAVEESRNQFARLLGLFVQDAVTMDGPEGASLAILAAGSPAAGDYVQCMVIFPAEMEIETLASKFDVVSEPRSDANMRVIYGSATGEPGDLAWLLQPNPDAFDWMPEGVLGTAPILYLTRQR